MTNSTDRGGSGLPSERRAGRLLWVTFFQVALGCLLIWFGLRSDRWQLNWYLPPIGIFIASWFWIPLALAARDKPRARARLWYGMLTAGLLVAALMVATALLRDDNWYATMIGVGLVGGICLVFPLAVAWTMTGETAGRLQQPWGRLTGGPQTVAGLGLVVDAGSDPDLIQLAVEVSDPRYLGNSASLEIYRLAEVHDTSPVNEIRLLSSQELVLSRERIDLDLPAGPIRGLAYRGKQVSVKTFAELRLYDGVLWDTTVRTEVGLPEHPLPEPQGDAKLLSDPKDAFCLVSNFRAIPLHRKAVAAVLLAVGGVVVAVNALVGLHDQFAPAGDHVMYAHDNGDGESQSPLMNSLFLSGLAGTGIWLALRRQLRTYTTFRLGQPPTTIGRDTVLPIDQLVNGRPVVDLEDVTVRVIACNLEKGAYTRGSGSNKRVVNFSEPIRAVVLFEQRLPLVRRGQPLEASLEGPVRFAPLFDLLHPPCEVSPTHGLSLQWEVQLLHDRFVDHELIAGPCEYRAADFACPTPPEPEPERAESA